MAAIVAQITKANWERQVKRRGYLPSDKSVYHLPAFDPCYRPEVHNVYLKRKLAFDRRHEKEREMKEVETMLRQFIKARQTRAAMESPLRLKIVKAVVALSAVSLPASLLIFLLMTFWLLDVQVETFSFHSARVTGHF